MFRKPVDNIGQKSIPDYAAYADSHVYNVSRFPAARPGRVFVGQRNEPFFVNLGEVFDLVNLNPVGPPNGEHNIIGDENITSLVLEVPISCLTAGTDPVIGGWTTASLPQGRVLNPRTAVRLPPPAARTRPSKAARSYRCRVSAIRSSTSSSSACATRIASTRAARSTIRSSSTM